MMQAILLREHGGPEVLRREELPIPEPGPGQVRVRIRAVSLNHLDIWVRKGGPAFHLENTKIPQLNAVIFDERFHDRIEGLLDDFLRLQLSQTNLLRDGFDDLFLGHERLPLERQSWG